jgi:hypothetical protein
MKRKLQFTSRAFDLNMQVLKVFILLQISFHNCESYEIKKNNEHSMLPQATNELISKTFIAQNNVNLVTCKNLNDSLMRDFKDKFLTECFKNQKYSLQQESLNLILR